MGTKPHPVGSDDQGIDRVVPMGAFVDPHWPEAAGASINFGHDKFAPIEDHPLEHGPSYGQAVGGLATTVDPQPYEGDADPRADFRKDDWKALAAEYELEVGGTVPELKARINEHEAKLEAEHEAKLEAEHAGGAGEPVKEGEPDGS